MKLCYVIGPYRANTREKINQNIEDARGEGIRVAAETGMYPVIPQVNTAHFEMALPSLPDSFWLLGTLALMLECDAVWLCRNWLRSTGSRNEVREAVAGGLEIYEGGELLDEEEMQEIIDRIDECEGHKATE